MARKRARLDHRPLLENPLVRSWYHENELRSRRTADVNLRQLGLCLHELELSPAGLLTIAREDPGVLRARLVQYAGALQKRGRLASYVAKTFTGVGSYLRHNEVEFRGFPKLRVIRGQSIENERVPTQDELARVLRSLGLRGQVSALLMGHAGLRPGAFAVYKSGEAALRLGDLPDLDLESLSFRKTPFLIRVPGTLSKNRLSYVTFGTSELAEAIAAYLRERRIRPRSLKGKAAIPEELTKESPLVAALDSDSDTGFVTVKAVTKEIRDGMGTVVPADTTWRPYVLRAFASTQLLIAETKGYITRDMREAILGHDLGVSGRYNLSKKLHPSMIEEMRSAYARCEPLLATRVSVGAAAASSIETFRVLLSVWYSEDEIAEIDLTDNAAVIDALKKGAARAATAGKDRVVNAAELPLLLDKGYRFVSPAGPGEFVVRPG